MAQVTGRPCRARVSRRRNSTTRRHALTKLLVRARGGPQDSDPKLRAHYFFRNVPGVWACTDPSCPAAPDERRAAAGRPALLASPPPGASCGCAASWNCSTARTAATSCSAASPRKGRRSRNRVDTLLLADVPELAKLPDQVRLERTANNYLVYWPNPAVESRCARQQRLDARQQARPLPVPAQRADAGDGRHPQRRHPGRAHRLDLSRLRPAGGTGSTATQRRSARSRPSARRAATTGRSSTGGEGCASAHRPADPALTDPRHADRFREDQPGADHRARHRSRLPTTASSSCSPTAARTPPSCPRASASATTRTFCACCSTARWPRSGMPPPTSRWRRRTSSTGNGRPESWAAVERLEKRDAARLRPAARHLGRAARYRSVRRAGPRRPP